MDAPKFPIPSQYRSAVTFEPCTDTRSDAEILKSINQYIPVSSERNVWTYWHSGVLTMPEWQQRNICDWVRICGPRWTIRVVDSVPDSPNYALKFFSATDVPRCFSEGTMDGPYPHQHSADFVRGACLYAHGGVWSDAGQLFLRSPDRTCWDILEDPESPYNICAPSVNSCMIANYFLAARKQDPFILRWNQVFHALWEGKTNFHGVSQHPLWKNMELEPVDIWGSDLGLDLEVTLETLNEYVGHMVCWIRICMIQGSSEDPFNGTDYWQKHVLLLNTDTENLRAEKTVGWDKATGSRMLELLTTRLDADPESEDFKLAHKVIWAVLTQASTQKVASSRMLKEVNLGTILNRPENKGKDRTPGTFAELLRYGCVNFKQTREIEYVKAPSPRKTINKSHLEA